VTSGRLQMLPALFSDPPCTHRKRRMCMKMKMQYPDSALLKPGKVLSGSLALVFVLSAVFAGKSVQAQTYQFLYAFKDVNFANGASPNSLIADRVGNPDCSAASFPDGCGTVFRLTKNSAGKWHETVLYSFGGDGDGWQPSGGLLLDASGNIYGTTASGDSGCSMGSGASCGNVFKLQRNGTGWMHTILYTFTGGKDGAQPSSGLIRDSKGNLYGVTNLGGSFGFGTIFKLDVNNNKAILHSFKGTDGAYPFADLVRDAAGNLYGTTTEGGSSKVGTVFKLETGGTLRVLHSFHGGSDGAYPFSTLFQDAAGNLYGATVLGGSKGQGTLFDIHKKNEAVTAGAPLQFP